MEDGFPLPETVCRLFEWIAQSCKNQRGREAFAFEETMAACGIVDKRALLDALMKLQGCPGLGRRIVAGIHNDHGGGYFRVLPEAAQAWEAYRQYLHETVCPECRTQSLRTVTRLQCTECGYERSTE